MPIRFQISHPERMVVGVAQGIVTLKDVLAFARELEIQKALDYRKIIDVMSGTAMLSEIDVAAYGDRLRELPPNKMPSGPIALVTNDANDALARLFAQLTNEQRPAQVFRSIHAARKWLQQVGPKTKRPK